MANYSSGSVSRHAIEHDGRLGEKTEFIQHQGLSINPKRQEGSHAHSVTLDSANRYAFVADLGMDKVMIYKFDSTQGRLTPNDEPWVQVKAGAGPRHFAFHPNDKYAYLVNELNSTITAFANDGREAR